MKNLSGDTERILRTAAVLILVDLAFLLIDLAQRVTHFSSDPRFKVTTDGGFAEWFQYVKFASIGVVLVRLYIHRRRFAYLALSCVFIYLFIDDAFQLHENVGEGLADRIQIPAMLGLRGRDLGELLVSAGIGSALLGLVGIAYVGSPPRERGVCRVAVGLLVALAFFGILVDMLHILVSGASFISPLMGALEDGGEMIVASVMAAYFYSLRADEGVSRLRAPRAAGDSPTTAAAQQGGPTVLAQRPAGSAGRGDPEGDVLDG